MKYNVVITREAEQDMEDIYNYIALELLAPENAIGQYNRIAEAILQLEVFPEAFKIVDFEPEHTMKIRRKFIDNYTIFYRILEGQVEITNVLYTPSDVEGRLKKYLGNE